MFSRLLPRGEFPIAPYFRLLPAQTRTRRRGVGVSLHRQSCQ